MLVVTWKAIWPQKIQTYLSLRRFSRSNNQGKINVTQIVQLPSVRSILYQRGKNIETPHSWTPPPPSSPLLIKDRG